MLITSYLDRIASRLECRDMFDEAERLDVISNTVEAGLKDLSQQIMSKMPRPSNVWESKTLSVTKRILMGPDDPEEKADRLVQLYSDAYGEDPDPAQIKQLEDQASRALSTLFGGLGGPMTEKAAFKVPTSVKDFLEYLIAVMKMMPKDS